jgi:hypothetical protein
MRSILSILGSLICYEKIYIAAIPQEASLYAPVDGVVGIEVFKNLIFEINAIFCQILKQYLKLKKYDYCEICLWNLTTLYLEYYHISSLKNDIFMVLMENISVKSIKVSRAAAEGLSIIAENCTKLDIGDESFVNVIDRIGFSISDHLVQRQLSDIQKLSMLKLI